MYVCVSVDGWRMGRCDMEDPSKSKKKKNKPQKTRKVEKKSPRNQQLESSPIRQNEQEY